MRAALLVLAIARVAAATPPPEPVVHDLGTDHVIDFVERRGDYHLRHSGVIMNAYAVTPDGRRAATGSYDGTILVWDLADGHVMREIATPHHNVWIVALSADGTLLASSGTDGFTRLWTVATGKMVWESKLDADALAFSPDGKRLLGDRLGAGRAWSVATGATTWTGQKREGMRPWCDDKPHGVVPLPDGRSVIELAAHGCREVRSGDVIDQMPSGYTVTMATLEPAKTVATLGGVGVYPSAIGVSPDGKRVGVVDEHAITVFDVAGKQPVVMKLSRRTVDNDAHVAPMVDPRYVVTWDVDSIVAWELATGAERWRVSLKNARARVMFAGSDTLAVVAGVACFGLDLGTGKELWRRERCTGMATSAKKIVLERGPSAIDVIDAHTGMALLPATPNVGPLGAVMSIAADASRVAVASIDGSVWLWPTATTPTRVPDATTTYNRAQVHFNADGTFVIVTSTATGDGMRIERYRGDQPTAATDVAQKDRFGLAAVIAGDHAVFEEVRERDYLRTVVDLAGTAKPSHPPQWKSKSAATTPVMRNEALNYAAITRDLSRAYNYGNNQALHAWNMRTGTLEAEVSAPAKMRLAPIALSSDEAHVLTGDETGAVELRRAKDLKLERMLAGPKRAVRMLAVSPDNKLVVAAAEDGLFVWRLGDGALLASVDFAISREQPRALVFTPDGKSLWVGTTLGNVHRFAVRAP